LPSSSAPPRSCSAVAAPPPRSTRLAHCVSGDLPTARAGLRGEIKRASAVPVNAARVAARANVQRSFIILARAASTCFNASTLITGGGGLSVGTPTLGYYFMYFRGRISNARASIILS
jgi:hypothetical protein